MKVAVVGCGYVGLVSGVGLASVGHEVRGIEADPRRRDQIAAGSPPFREPGLTEMLQAELSRGNFAITSDLAATADADVVLLAIQTPPNDDGSIDLGHLRAAASDLAEALGTDSESGKVVAVRSTVVPGTAERMLGPIFDSVAAVASNPEFLREGSAVEDFTNPDRIVIGCRDQWAGERVADLYRPFGAPIFLTSPATAELAKYASNAFLASLISFSNEIARICEALPGVDVEDVLGILHADRRLNVDTERRAEIVSYIKAGCGFGGSCLPKDLSAVIAVAEAEGVELPMLSAVRAVNEEQPARIVASAERALRGLQGRRVAVLGAAFKAGTDDLRSSPGLRIVAELLERGAAVRIFDPLVATEALAEYSARGVEIATGLDEALSGADAAVLTTTAPEFATVGELAGRPEHAELVVVDARRVLDPKEIADDTYIAVGRAPDSAGRGIVSPVPR